MSAESRPDVGVEANIAIMRVLLTTKYWFMAPDGNQYRAVWGNMTELEDSFSFGLDDKVLLAKKQLVAIINCPEKPIGNDVYCVD